MLPAKINWEYKQAVQLLWIQLENQTLSYKRACVFSGFVSNSLLQWSRIQQYPDIMLASNVVIWIARVLLAFYYTGCKQLWIE